MVDDFIKNKEFLIPIIENKVKGKDKNKEYHQHMIKLPKKLVTMLGITKDSKMHVEMLPVQEGQTKPGFKIEIKNG